MGFRTTIFAAIGVALSFTTPGTAAVVPAGGVQNQFTVPHVPGQILVKRAIGVSTTDIETLLTAFGGSAIDFSAGAGIDVVKINADSDLQAAIVLL